MKQWQPHLIILFTVKQTLRAGWYEQAGIDLLSELQSPYTNEEYSLRNSKSSDMVKATITRCDLSPRFFCIDVMLLWEFESDKI